jgi:hypothetical protein
MRKVVFTGLIIVGLIGAAFGQSAFDMSSDTIERNFKGDDIVKVVTALNQFNPYGKKTIYGPFNKSDTDRIYAFKLADHKVYGSPSGVWVEKMTVNSWRDPVSLENKSEDHYLIKDMGTKVKSYTGQNVFGARTRVEATKEKRYFVAPINGTGNIGKLSVKPEGGKVGVIFICKPARHSQDEGYIARPHGKGYAATWDMPWSLYEDFTSVRVELQEVWVYDQDSGKVLLKKKIEKRP